jgi:MtN3 and saliva related transmembrane protein
MDTVTLIGSLAAIASMTSFAPQAWKIIKSRKTADISAGMYTLTVTGFALWTAYGVMLMQWPIIVTNSVCLSLAAFILMILPVAGRLYPDDEAAAPPQTQRGGGYAGSGGEDLAVIRQHSACKVKRAADQDPFRFRGELL